jgi:hypothetical protein
VARTALSGVVTEGSQDREEPRRSPVKKRIPLRASKLAAYDRVNEESSDSLARYFISIDSDARVTSGSLRGV